MAFVPIAMSTSMTATVPEQITINKKDEKMSSKSQFTGTAGEFYVAYQLTKREIHAAITLGNATHVDILASSADGKRSLSVKVKTSSKAYRRKRYGHEGFEWDVNKAVIGKHSESLVYAFVDFKGDMNDQPDVYWVPSIWVANFVKPNWSRFMYFLPLSMKQESLNCWDLIDAYLKGDQHAIDWANSWPQDKLVQWGS